MIRQFCRICSTLTSVDIDKIEKLQETAIILSNVLNVDTFIDCPTKDSEKALVVHHSRPVGKSLYSKNIAGEIAEYINEPAVFRTLTTGMPSKNYKAITQEGESVFQNVIAIKNDRNEIIGVLILEHPTQKKELIDFQDADTEPKVIKRLSEERHTIPELVKDGVVIFNSSEKITYANGIAKKIYEKLGFSDDIIGENFQNVIINKIEFKNILKNRKIDVVEVNVLGMVLTISYFATIADKNKQNVIMIIRDITQEKNKEQELILKSVAIKEIHHRVKNNLQTIASLLRIQSRRTDNSEVKKILEETISRILSIATTHEVLSKNGLDNLNIKEIVDLIYKNYSTKTIDKQEKIEFTVLGDNFNISSEKATALALVINEIIQNIVDYAFPEEGSGVVKILIRRGKFFSQIIISDNGVGVSEEKLENTGLGLMIVEKIVKEQLKGNFSIKSKLGVGTVIKLEIKNEY
ncbi:sensor histidine kinase [Cetobacterium sp. 8H]|uniref:sensor histidine kinase n=1 Tax=Cetobacterium sp. 8H TaxID=2759681 RepID=UPI00163CD461|nr:histidine kinase N-terminal domain-containing protein [Cetobacterium sp. 8H]MBC2851694.1 sensor histidine kinase [Cetobacterium sp. 8H]